MRKSFKKATWQAWDLINKYTSQFISVQLKYLLHSDTFVDIRSFALLHILLYRRNKMNLKFNQEKSFQ